MFNKNLTALLSVFIATMVTTAGAAEVPITGNVASKCIITTDTPGVYGNPTPNVLSTDPASGGVVPVVRFDVIIADFYKAAITVPDAFTESPALADVVTFDGEVTVGEVSDAAMSAYDTSKIEYNNVTEVDLTIAGSTWFNIASSANYGYDKAFPAGTYRAVVDADCIAL